MWIVDYLVDSGKCQTHGEARRLLRSNQLKLNGFELEETSTVPDKWEGGELFIEGVDDQK